MAESKTNVRSERNGSHQSVASRVGNTVYEAADSAASTMGDSLEKSANYLKQKTPDDMLNDATDVVRNNPITSVLIGLGIGFLLARVIRR